MQFRHREGIGTASRSDREPRPMAIRTGKLTGDAARHLAYNRSRDRREPLTCSAMCIFPKDTDRACSPHLRASCCLRCSARRRRRPRSSSRALTPPPPSAPTSFWWASFDRAGMSSSIQRFRLPTFTQISTPQHSASDNLQSWWSSWAGDRRPPICVGRHRGQGGRTGPKHHALRPWGHTHEGVREPGGHTGLETGRVREGATAYQLRREPHRGGASRTVLQGQTDQPRDESLGVQARGGVLSSDGPLDSSTSPAASGSSRPTIATTRATSRAPRIRCSRCRRTSSYDLTRRAWAAVNATWYGGADVSVNGGAPASRQNNARLAARCRCQTASRQSLKSCTAPAHRRGPFRFTTLSSTCNRSGSSEPGRAGPDGEQPKSPPRNNVNLIRSPTPKSTGVRSSRNVANGNDQHLGRHQAPNVT